MNDISAASVLSGVNDNLAVARNRAVGGLNEDPEQAARAVQLAQVTGVPSTSIYGDVDSFVEDQKAKATSYIVRNNPYIAEYINSHPLASAISNDDYHALDEHSENLQRFYSKSTLQKIHESIGFGRIAAIAYPDDPLATFEQIAQDQYNDPNAIDISQTHPNLYKELRDARAILEGGLAAVSTPIVGAQRLLSHYFGREAGAILEHEVMRGDILSSGTPSELIEAYKIAEPWLRRGQEPPAGLHPALDKIASSQVKDDIKNLDDVIQSGAATETQQRSPEFAANFNSLHGDREIGLYHEAVRKLYGDKAPSSDDGILGWIPDLGERLASAEQFGGDVWVPAKDFAAKVDPEVWKALRDFTRVREGGLTLDEAKNLEEKQSIAEPLQSIRASAEMEPLLSVGDRKVTIQGKMFQTDINRGQEIATREGKDWDSLNIDQQVELANQWKRENKYGESYNFDIHDESGNKIGALNLSKNGNQLYVDGIQAGVQAHSFYTPNFLGPSLVRDLKRQLKQLFPDVETITGHRVTGAREKAGTWQDKSAMPVVKLELNDDPEAFRQLLGGIWEQPYQSVAALFATDAKGLATNSPLGQMVLSELRRLAPKAEAGVAHGLEVYDQPALGAYLPDIKKIIVSLESKDPFGTAGHEAIHALRDMKFFTDNEWRTLEASALEHGWVKKYDIDTRYAGEGSVNQHEEAIAHAYQDWRKGAAMPVEVHGIFERLKQFFQGLLDRVSRHLGLKVDSWEDIFKRVESGEVGAREPPEMTQARLEGGHEPFRSVDEPTGEEPSLSLYDRARALGITQAHEDRMLRLAMQRNAEDFKAHLKRAEEEQRRRSTKEWKARRIDLRDEVRDSLSQRQDISIDRLMSETQTKLHPDFLTDEQKALLPKDYIQKKNGLNPDDIAPIFGYPSGDALVEHLSRLTEDRRRAGMSPRDYLNRLIDVETDRRLNQEFGDREGKIKDEALDQALTETQMNLTHEQTLAWARKAGVEPKFTVKDVEAMVRGAVDQMNIKELDPYKLLQAAGREGKKANEAGAKGKWAEAYRLAQTQQHATIAAKIAKEYLRKERNLDRLFRTYAKVPTKEIAKKIDQAYYNYVQQVMIQVGQKIARTKQGLADALEKEPYNSLVAFVDAKSASGHSLYLPEFLRDGAPPLPVEKMTYGQFKELHDFVARMDHSAREEKTITRQGEKADLEQTIDDLIAGLPSALPPRTFDPSRPENLAKETLKSNWWSLITVRSMAKRLDRGDPKGILTDIIANRATAADANETALWKAQVTKLREAVGKIPDMDKLVDNKLFRDPNTGDYIPMRKRNVLAVLQYWGERTNRIKLTKGWDVNPDEVEAWLGKNTKPEDWDRAQAIGKLFDELFNQASNMSHRVSGVGIEKLPLQPFTDPHGVDRKGWYSPAKYESMLPGKSAVLLGKTAIDDDTYFRADTPQGYGKARTGYVAPFDLSLDAVPVRMKQMIHDIAWRETILDMGKIVYNSKFQRAINARYGKHQMDEFKTYVADMANSSNIDSLAEYYRETAFEYFRRNTIGTLVGMNPSTVAKHGLTAAVNSLTQVGPLNFLREFGNMFRGSDAIASTQLKMAYDKSEVIQNRMQNIEQLIRGHDPKFSFEPGKFSQWRDIMMHLGSFPVALGDFMSTVPTWLAAYKDKIAAGETEGFARSYADRAVIEAHGSALRSNQPSVMRRTGALARTFSSLYGFFSHMLQKQYEFAWKAKDIWNGEKPLDIQGQWATPMMSNLWSYWIAPAIIEEMITPYTNKEKESWGTKATKTLAVGASSSLLYIRDFVRAIFNPGEPEAGLIGTTMKSGTDLIRDIQKHQPTSREHMGKVIKDSFTLAGVLTGLTNAQEGRTAEYVYRYLHGLERPKGPWDVAVGARYGTTEHHSHTFAEWWKHMSK